MEFITKKQEYRPLIHFSAEKNWINDPNGLVYINGQYHLFFQHYPSAPHWGPMHWGHAVSTDLLHWEELPIALYPDELGFIFSGSCVLDVNNVSGFGTKDCPPLIAIYTSHSPNGNVEQQSIAYSTDYVHFEKYYGNPVIKNSEKKDFRDPKVFWNEKKQCYSLVLAAGPKVEFYASKDLKHWEKTGDFEPVSPAITGICECPDCFCLPTADGDKYVLIISMIVSKEEQESKNVRMEHITQYFVGEFDGETFHQTQKDDEVLLLDHGTDNYAAVTFQNLKERLLIGWADNWDYAHDTPCKEEGFAGKMTLARRLSLVKVDAGYRLCNTFEGVEKLWGTLRSLPTGENRLRSQTFYMRGCVEQDGKIELKNSNGEKLMVEITKDEIIVDGRMAGNRDFEKRYQSEVIGLTKTKRQIQQENHFEIVFDHSILEVIADNGITPISVSVYPQYPYEEIIISGDIKIDFCDNF